MKSRLIVLTLLLFVHPLIAMALDKDMFGMPQGFNPNGDKELVITRAGKVWIEDSGQHRDTSDFGSSVLKLNDKTIAKFEGHPFGAIEKRINAKDFDLLLITVDLGGSGTLPELRAIAIKPDGYYHLFDEVLTEDFNDATLAHELRARVVNNRIYIDLGYEEKFHKMAELEFDHIKITKQRPVKNERIPISLCEELYSDLRHSCTYFLPYDTQRDCSKKEDEIGAALHRKVYYYDDFPAFSSRRAFDLCNKFCFRGKRSLTLRSFAEKVCGIK